MRLFPLLLRTLLLLSASGLLTGLVLMACAKPAMQKSGTPAQSARLKSDSAVMADGFSLPLAFWAPETAPARAVVLALHGFNDYHAAFTELGGRLAEDGILTYAYDQRGFGATEGRGIWPGVDTLVDDARAMLTLLHERHPHLPLYILGKSMGGAVAINAVTRAPAPPVQGTLLVAPAVWARQTMPWYQRIALGIGSRLAPGYKVTGKGLGIRPSDNVDMLRALGRDPMVIKETRIDAVDGLGNLMDAALAAVPRLSSNTLILYGEKDQIIPHRPTCRMLDILPNGPDTELRFVLYPDGYHMLTRDLQRAVVHADISAWLLSPNGVLPSKLQTEPRTAVQRLCGRPRRTDI
ncbi:MAG: lysophospholipase [Aquisalimonadaceae bacterium]